MSFFQKLKKGLGKTRDNIVSGLDTVFNGASEIDDDLYEEIEEILIMADVGVSTTSLIIEKLKVKVKELRIREPLECRRVLIDTLDEFMTSEVADLYAFEDKKSVIIVIGVNGVGKTTSIGKLASTYKSNGKKVLLAAADTFRAAATEQIEVWAKRSNIELIKGGEGSDPSAVIYDALQAAKARNVDMLICDTAGRLHNKKNLMVELNKMYRIIEREFPAAHREVLIVLDATTGQNALNQAREFNEVASIDGIVLTKMDGSAKGGIAIAIQSELEIPVKYIGVGEGIDDLQKFNSKEFINALFDGEVE